MCKDGHLTVRPDGKLDTEDRTNKNYLEKTERAYGYKYTDKKGDVIQDKIKHKATVKKSKVKNEQQSNLENNREIPEESAETVLEGIPDDLKLMTKHDLDRMKSAMKVLQDQLKHERDRGLYVDKDVVKKTFHAIYRIDTEEFLQLSSTLSAKICQDIFGTNEPELMTKTSEVLDTEFYKVQNHIRVTLNRDLGAMGIEGVG